MPLTPSPTSSSSLPIGEDDQKIQFPPGRPTFLPDMYIKRHHPLHKGSGKAYYYIQDGLPEGMARTAKIEHNKMSVPEGGEQVAIDQGFLKLVPGDAVFVRLLSAPSSGMEDVPVCWLTGGDLFPKELRERVAEVRERALGSRPTRSRRFREDRTGGTRFDREFPPKENVRDGRCYPLGTSYEFVPKLYAPCAQGRRLGTSSETLSYRADLLEVTLDMATRCLLAGPDEVASGLRINHELLNAPTVGVCENTFFGANQINIAPAVKGGSDASLGGSLGSAGIEHIDPNDSPSHFTNMTCASDVPSDFDPGRFFIFYPGVFYEQGDLVSFCFSGLRRHGGTSPVAPPGTPEEVLEWATRLTLVSYPPTGTVTSAQRRVMCADGIGSYVTITPEMIVPDHLAPVDVTVNHSTFSRDGLSVMSRSSLMNFFCRSFVQMIVYVLRQLPRDLDARFDSDAFLGSFSFLDEGGVRRGVGPWELGPGWRSRTSDRTDTAVPDLVSQRDYIMHQHSIWLQFYAKYAGHIPYAVAVKKGVRALEGWDSDEIHAKLTNLKYTCSESARGAVCVKVDEAKGRDSSRPTTYGKGGMDVEALSCEGGSRVSLVEFPTKVVKDKTVDYRLSKPLSCRELNIEGTSQKDLDAMDIDDWFAEQVQGDRGDFDAWCQNIAALESERCPGTRSVDDHAVSSYNDAEVNNSRSEIENSDEMNVSGCRDCSTPTLSNSDSGPKYMQGSNSRDTDEYDTRLVKVPSGDLRGQGQHDVGASGIGTSNLTDMQVEKASRSQGSSLIGDRTLATDDPANQMLASMVPVHEDSLARAEGPFDDELGRMLDSIEIDQNALDMLSEADKSLFRPARNSDNDLRSSLPLSPRSDSNVCNTNKKPLPGYLRIISPETVYIDLLAVESSAMELTPEHDSPKGTDAPTLIENLNLATTNRPLDPSTLVVIMDTSAGLGDLLAEEAGDCLKLKHLRSCIMLANYAYWMWLEDRVPSYVSSVITDSVGDRCRYPWLDNLVRDVCGQLERRNANAIFKPESFGLPRNSFNPATLDMKEYIFIPSQPNTIRCSVMSAVHDIVAVWLGFPTDDASYWKAVYVETIYNSIGLEPLFLDCVWKTYQRASKKMLESRSKIPLALEVDLYQYPLFDPTSRMRKDLSELSKIVCCYVAGPSKSNVPQAPVQSIIDRRVEAFRKFVSDCFFYAFEQVSTLNMDLDNALKNDGDHYQPFRERGPSRINLTKPKGPFSPENVRTLEGLFSALLSRATSFDTKMSREGRSMFSGPADFFNATLELGCDKESDYCNRASYGQTDSRKSADLVYQYWDTITSGEPWVGLTCTTPLNFIDAFNYFQPPSGPPRFPRLGKLGAYLLAADYVYAGIVKEPTLTEILRVVKKVNKGPMRALELLGLTPTRTKSRRGTKHHTEVQSISSAFEEAYLMVKSSIPEEHHKTADVDYILTEHALCKYARASSGKKPLIRF